MFLRSDAYEHTVHNSGYAADRSPSFDQKYVSVDWVVVAQLGLPSESFLSFLGGGLKTVGGNVYDEMG
jgi:hypothetical protein